MSIGNPTGTSHSAVVRMDLHFNGHVLAIAQMGPDFLVLAEPAEHAPTDALIAMSIDGRERRWTVRLHEGISAERRRTPIARCTPVNESAVG